ncbi:imidazole glycerol phosphate synthase subunit HisH, partial [Vibrio cholerae]
MLTIIDYGVGNVLAFANVFNRLNIPFVIAKNTAELVSATKLILPGVGSFDFAMQTLNESGMRAELERMVIEKRVPVIGICVGMQMLADSSEEGELPGLGWIKGTVRQFKFEKELNLTMPHMGWNDVTPSVTSPLFYGLE